MNGGGRLVVNSLKSL